MPNGVKKILVVRFSSLGDLILTTPFYRELKRLFPKAQVDLLTSRTFAPLFEGNPHLTQVWEFDRKDSAQLDLWARQIKAQDYDLAFDLHRSLRSRLLLFKAFGAFSPKVKKIDKRSLNRNLLLAFKINRFQGPQAQRRAYLKLLEPLAQGLKLQGHTELFPSPQAQTKAKAILAQTGLEGKPLVALGPSASFGLKCWPKESFLELGLELAERGFGLVALGGPGDLEPPWLEEASQGKIKDLSGKLDFLESAALLSQATLAVSNDSAIVHFSEAVGRPVLALFGPTVQEFGFAPFLPQSLGVERDLPCRPCSRNGKGKCRIKDTQACLVGLSARQVGELALERLG